MVSSVARFKPRHLAVSVFSDLNLVASMLSFQRPWIMALGL